MEIQMHTINNLKEMEIVDINTGAKIGYIRDFKIDCEEHKIVSIIIPSSKLSWFNKSNFFELEWAKVVKIGIDVILVDGKELVSSMEE